jgi:hypothetical protein
LRINQGELIKGEKIYEAHEIYSLYSTSEYMIAQIIDFEGERKTLVIRPNSFEIGRFDKFLLKPIEGKVNNVYSWDNFLVFYAEKDIILFKAPPSAVPSAKTDYFADQALNRSK